MGRHSAPTPDPEAQPEPQLPPRAPEAQPEPQRTPETAEAPQPAPQPAPTQNADSGFADPFADLPTQAFDVWPAPVPAPVGSPIPAPVPAAEAAPDSAPSSELASAPLALKINTNVGPGHDDAASFDELIAPESTDTDDDEPEVDPRGSRLDRWWAHVLRTPARKRAWYWGGPLFVTLIGGILRFWNLAYPHVLMFDETYYVKDAWTLSRLGYEAKWPDNPNPAFESGDVFGFLTDPSFVIHPPLGKWLIWLGMSPWGPESSFAWRFTNAVLGTLAIFIIALLARALFKSTLLATIAGGLFAIDGLAITMSRIGLLDQSLMLLVLLAFCTLLADRRWYERRFAARLAAARDLSASPGIAAEDVPRPFTGPVLWWRPWLIATGVLLGAATGVKWSGLYFIAFIGIYTVVADALHRRRNGVTAWATAAVLMQAPVNAILLVIPAAGVYLSTWTGWLVTKGGWGRDWADNDANAWQGFFSWVPRSLQSLWHYHEQAYNAALGITSPHSWAANPLTWPLMLRPTLVYRTRSTFGERGCTSSQCIETVSTIANPLIWWSANAAVVFLIIWYIKHRDWRIPFILLGVAAGYLPWLQYLNRTVFQFYTIAWLPALILALTYVIGMVLGKRTDRSSSRAPAIAIVGGFLALVTLVSAFFYPLWIGANVPYWFWALHSWLPFSWQ